MKYRLKKDFFIAKAGTEVRYINDEGFYPKLSIKSVNIMWVELEGSKIYLESLINDGWIEEVKPRIWLLEIDEMESGDINYSLRPLGSKGRMLSKNSEIIKVLEVIE